LNNSTIPVSILVETLYRQGDAAHDAGRLDAAERLLRAALAADPGHWLSRYTLAVVLQDRGHHDQAAALYAAALAVKPDHLKAWNNYGIALQYSGRREAAIDAFRRALELSPGHAGALLNLSGLLAETGRTDEARAVLDPFCSVDAPNLFDLRRALILPPVAASTAELKRRRTEMLQDLRRITERPPRLHDPLREVGRTPFYLAYQPDSDREILEALATLYRRACPELSFVAPGCRAGEVATKPGGRRRIGFASFYFYEHSVGRVIRGLVERLPRERFEVVVVFLGGQADDPLARDMAAAADEVVATPYDLAAARQIIAETRLDLLCLPDSGMDPLSYFLGFARLAPVQCTTWGLAETSGLDTIDWFVSAAAFERPDADADYIERLHRLPGVASPACYARPSQLPGGVSHLTAGSGPNYFCPQTLYKLHPDFDALVAGILAAQPSARLYLVRAAEPAWNGALVTRLAAVLGTAMAQVVWLDHLSRADYQATMADADVILDPPHFTGGNTSLEAFALAKPVVTLQGATLRSRLTAGFYRAMGLAEVIAKSNTAYIEQAIELGQNPASRAALAQRIAEANGVLFDDENVPARWADFFAQVLSAR
jgi:predicted O-linked N-acetylglucosamine transferase (SPINDLY family)